VNNMSQAANLHSPKPTPRTLRQQLVRQNVAIAILLLLAAATIVWQVNRLAAAAAVLQQSSQRVTVVLDVRQDSTALIAAVSRLLPLEDSTLFSGEVSAMLDALRESHNRLALITDESVPDEAVYPLLLAVREQVQTVITLADTMVRQAELEQWHSVRVRVGVLTRDQQQLANEVDILVEEVKVIEESANVAVASARRAAVLYLVSVIALTLALTYTMQWVTIRRIARPVEHLTQGAIRLASGHLSDRVPVESDDELGQLANSFNRMAERLQLSYGELEQRVADRTRDLALATEIGRSLSRVQGLDTLLIEAVEMIRSRYDLYYAQIYLADDAGRNLILHAGTGVAGQTLVQRGHRLRIGPGSINGAAASERRPIIDNDTTTSAIFKPNPLLPETRSEMAVPLIAPQRLVGVLDLQSKEAAAFSEESTKGFEALAGQLATAVENARLFTEFSHTQVALQDHARRLTRSGWQDFFDAIERSEYLAYAYDLAGVHRVEDALASSENGHLTLPIVVSGEPLGQIEVAGEPNKAWSDDEANLVRTIANQVSRQIENLRLLNQADRYRAEAEEANRRLLREGWRDYLQQTEASQPGYVYDLNEVSPLTAVPDAEKELALSQILLVQGEPIGELVVTGAQATDTTTSDFVAVVAERLSAHLENLRLSEQRERALAETEERAAELAALNQVAQAALNETEALYQASTAINEADNYDEILAALREHTIVGRDVNLVSLALFDRPSTDAEPVPWVDAVAYWSRVQPENPSLRIDMSNFPSYKQVIRRDMPVLIEDVEREQTLDDKTRSLFLKGFGGKSALLVPLIAGDQWIGYVSAFYVEKSTFDEAEVRRLVSLTNQAAVSIQNIRLLEQTQLRAEELAVLNEAGRELARLREVGALQDAVHRHISRLMEVTDSFIALYDERRDEVSFRIYGQGESVEPAMLHRRTTNGITEYVIRTRQPLLIQGSIRQWAEANDVTLVGRDAASWLGVPMLVGGDVVGVIAVQSFEKTRLYDTHHRDLLTAFASQTAISVQNARLFEQTQRRAEELTILNEMGRDLTEMFDVNTITESIYHFTSRMMDTTNFYLALYDELTQEVSFPIAVEDGKHVTWNPRRLTAGLSEYIIRSRKPLLLAENVRERLEQLGIQMIGAEAQCWLGMPILIGDKAIGLMAVQSKTTSHLYDENHLGLLNSVAAQAAIAIENARLFSQIQARARREQILREITARVRSSVDVDTIMRTAVQEIGQALGRQAFVYIGDQAAGVEATGEAQTS
jgi:GAF domain-containing protein/HAMP domain-containing protein